MSGSRQSHSRRNALTGDWVLVSPNRLERPWQGQVDDIEPERTDAYVDDCYLCPGNARADGQRNPDYTGPYVFDNDFPALSASGDQAADNDDLLTSRPETGVCRVVCYTEQHHLRMATLNETDRLAAVQCLIDQFTDLDRRDSIEYVQIFENRGQMMGCSNSHPHAQVWATSSVPAEPAKERAEQARYFDQHRRPLLIDYAETEIQQKTRLVYRNESWLVVVPYWAVWPYEMLILPIRAIAAPDTLTPAETALLSNALRAALVAYESLFGGAAPYSMGWHPRPSDGRDHPEWQFHIHIYPPLLRSATVRKHLVGFEMLAQPQRDLTPELAADRLRTALSQETSNE